jgi:acetyl-CoA carboxylase carboxyltransferase component
VDGRTVFVYAHDFRIFGGALGEAHAQKIHKVMDLAEAAGAPLVSLNDGAGAGSRRASRRSPGTAASSAATPGAPGSSRRSP